MSTAKKYFARFGIDNNGQTSVNLADPVNPQDGSTKNFSSNASNLTSGTVAVGRLPAFTGDATAAIGTGNLVLANSGVIANTYGSSSMVPVITFDSKGRATSVTNVTITPTAIGAASLSAISNIDNTSDMDKPVSTAQAAADTATLNSAKAYAEGLVVGLLDDRGNFDASSNLFPATGGSGVVGAILKGDVWYISVAGTLGGSVVGAGDTIRALVDAPGQTASNWSITETNIGFVPYPASNPNGYTANSTDAQLRDRSTHTGTQSYTTITGLGTLATQSGTFSGSSSGSNTGDQTITLSGDGAGSGTGAIVFTLANTAVTAGAYGSATQAPVVQFDSKGRATNASNVTITPAWTNITSKPTTIAGFGITDAITLGNVVGSALGSASAGVATTAARSDHVHPLMTLDTLSNVTMGAKSIGDMVSWDGTVWANVAQSTLTVGNATKLATARSISATGDATGTTNFDGSANVSMGLTLANTGVTAGTYGSASVVPVTTFDAKGRATNVVNTPITPAAIGAVSSTGNNLPLTNGALGSVSLVTSTTTPNQIVDAIAVASFRTVKYLIQVTSGTSYHVTELLVIHDGTTPFISEFGTISTGVSLATFDADITAGSLRLLVTPTNAASTILAIRTAIVN